MYVTAIQGTGYYRSAKVWKLLGIELCADCGIQVAYTLLSSNLVRYGALDRIGNASVLLGKLVVCVTTCLVFWFYLNVKVSVRICILGID